jgi:NTP pyrophosphatase (non-canonical NTP hydrolase)
MGYGTNGLSFNTLRGANVRRHDTDKYAKCADWIPAQWMQALVGEVGECANLLKKVDRGDFPIESVREEISKELADIQIYLDLLAYKLGVDLGAATQSKFNEVSERIASNVYIGDDGDWHLKG